MVNLCHSTWNLKVEKSTRGQSRKLKKVREKLPVTCTYGGRSPAEITSTNLRNLKELTSISLCANWDVALIFLKKFKLRTLLYKFYGNSSSLRTNVQPVLIQFFLFLTLFQVGTWSFSFSLAFWPSWASMLNR